MSGEKTSKTATGDYNAKKVVELERHIYRLEMVIQQLQQRVGQIAATYELEIASTNAELQVERRYGYEETD